MIRAGLSKFRELAADPDAHRRGFTKASEHDKNAIQQVLNKMGCRTEPTPTSKPSGPKEHNVPTLSFASVGMDFDSLGRFFENFGTDIDKMNEPTPQGTPRSSASTHFHSPRDSGNFCESRTADEIDRALLNLANSSPPLPGKPSGQSKLVDASRANAKEAKAFTKKKVARGSQERLGR